MNIENKETTIEIKVKKTNSNIGIKENDCWCIVDFKVKNNEIHYSNRREVLTYKELLKTIETLKKYINKEIKKERLTYIKNYFIIDLFDNKMNLELIEALKDRKKFKTYIVTFNEEEIKEFVEYVEKSIEN